MINNKRSNQSGKSEALTSVEGERAGFTIIVSRYFIFYSYYFQVRNICLRDSSLL